MKKYKKAGKWAVVLASILVIESFTGAVSPYIDTYAYTNKTATVNATTLNVRSGPGTTYSIVTKLANGASVTVVNEKNGSDGGLWYEIRFNNSNGQTVTGYVTKSYLKFSAVYTSDADFESKLSAQGFPESYKVRLRALHAQYPNWVFTAQKTNLDWNTAIKEESLVGKTLVHTNSMSSWKSTENGAYDWNSSTWVGFDGSTWVTASEDIVKYFMDPRNFLDETNVFQFLTHTYDSNKHTLEGLNTMVRGTFLSGSTANTGTSQGTSLTPPDGGSATDPGNAVGPGANIGPGAKTETQGSSSGNVSLESPQASITPNHAFILMEYGPGASLTGPSANSPAGGTTTGTTTGSPAYANMIMNAATQSGVNPYVLAAMIIQEQGSAGTGKSISGTESGYAGVYNFFNIEAYQSGSMTAVQRGLWWASQTGNYERPWNTPEKSILGGALYYGNNYVKVGQDTFYLKKYNVQGANLYKHQYMTNVQGAASEAAVYSKAYNNDMKQTGLEFKIPVYNNMPENPCSQPTGDGNPNNKLSGLSVDGFVMTPSFDRDTREYNLIVDSGVTNIKVNASALYGASSVKGTGTIALQSGNNDIKVSVTAQNGNVREYILHVVRQANGPTYSSGNNNQPDSGSSNGNNSSGGGSSSGGSWGPGASGSKAGNDAGTPGGSNITIAPDGSTQTSTQTGSTTAAQSTAGAGQQGSEYGPGGAKSPAQTEAQTQAQTQPQAQQPASSGTTSKGSGDINGDGKVNSLDVLKLQRYLLGLEKLTEAGKAAADLNGDGKVNAQDLLLLQKKVLKM